MNNFLTNYCLYKENEKYGVIDRSNNIIIPAEYDMIYNSHVEELFCVKKDDKKGIISSANQIILPVEYDMIGEFDSDGLASIRKNGQYGFVNTILRLFFENLLTAPRSQVFNPLKI